MALPKAAVPVDCDLCGVSINQLVSRYLWVGSGWRGRGTPAPHQTASHTLCGPCGELVTERLSGLLALARSTSGVPS